jgi:hypothetical protein
MPPDTGSMTHETKQKTTKKPSYENYSNGPSGLQPVFSLRRLVCEKLHVFLCLDLCVEAAWHRLWGRNVTVRIDATRALWCSSKLHR